MSRINTNISSVIAQNSLTRNQNELNVRLQRLSTGLRINRGADDPAGLIISERLRSDIQGVDQGIKNGERASSMISTTEASLAEVNELLNSIRSLVVESANTGATSVEERRANQLQIDSAIDSITRISNTATFGGLRLLDGTLDYRLSGLATSAITSARINNASFVGQSSLRVDVDVVASAQTGALFYNGSTTPPGVTLSAMTLEIAGPTGVQVVTIAEGRPLSLMVQAINNLANLTGVQASLINGDANSGIVFQSNDYGSDAFVSVKRLGGPTGSGNSFSTYKYNANEEFRINSPFGWSGLISGNNIIVGTDDRGQDVQALVNGNLGSGKGLNLSINSPSLGLDVQLTEDFATDLSAATKTFYITGGGALFQLGPSVNASQQANIGIPSIAASRIGSTLVGGSVETLASLKSGQGNSIQESVDSNDFAAAQSILEQAIQEVTTLRGRLGAFERNVLETNVRSLQSQFENLTSSESQIRDADFAVETSRLTRAQILSSAGTSTLSLANQQSQQVLQLLG
jgi:flagellin